MIKKSSSKELSLHFLFKFNALLEGIKLIRFIPFWELYKIRNSPRYNSGVAKTKIGIIEYVDPKTFCEGLKEIFHNEIFKIDNFSNKSPIVIDCGANIGLATIYFATKYNAKVFAYEADPYIFKCFKRNINNLSIKNNVTVFNKAVWINDQGVEFEIEGGYSGQIQKTSENLSGRTIHVPSISLRTIISEFESIDFLKVDIEGAENQAILECSGVLNKINYIFLEYHSYADQSQKLGDILNLLKSEGFRYHIKDEFTSDYPFEKVNKLLDKDLQLNIFAFRN